MSSVLQTQYNDITEKTRGNPLAQAIFARLIQRFETGISKLSAEQLTALNSLNDTEFSLEIGKKMASASVFINAQAQSDVIERTDNQAKFIEMLESHGGGYSSSELAHQLDISRAAISKRRKEGKLFYLKVAGKTYHPAFQFDENLVVSEHFKKVLSILKDKDEMAAFSFLVQFHVGSDEVEKPIYELLKGKKQPRYIYQQIFEKAQMIDAL